MVRREVHQSLARAPAPREPPPRRSGAGARVLPDSTTSALLEGVYDGELTYGELARHGDFGIGTFDALDGEMVALDGAFYRLTADGKAHRVDPSMRTPFAVVTFFRPTASFALAEPLTYDELQVHLDGTIGSANLFYALKIGGTFPYVRARSMPRQTKPYRPLGEVAKTQPVFEFRDVRGALVGFRFPDYARGLNVPGYHLHFISEDRAAGGHVLDCRVDGVTAEVDHTANLHLEMPEDATFLAANLGEDKTETLKRAER